MSSSTSTYLPFSYSYGGFGYTGTAFQPDTLSLFVKKGNKLLIHHTEPVVNLVAKWIPLLGSMAGVWRVIQAVGVIFLYPSRREPSSSLLWNAFKNFARGIVEAIPGSGICLIIFDAARNRFVISSKIAKQVANEDNIGGFALDGKVLHTIDLASFERRKNIQSISEEHSFIVFTRFVLEYLQSCAQTCNAEIPLSGPLQTFKEESLKGAQ